MPKNKMGASKKPDELTKLYRENDVKSFQKPIRVGRKILVGSFLIAIVFGFLAGFGGGLSSLIFKIIRIPYVGELNLEGYLPKREITISTQEKITVTPDVRAAEVTKAAGPQIVRIFVQKSSAEKLLGQIYSDGDSLGQGVILTSDGWIMTNSYVAGDAKEDYAAETSDHRIYLAEKRIADPMTGIVFLKIQASGLPVVKIASPETVSIGQNILVLGGYDALAGAYVGQLKYFPPSQSKSQAARQQEDLIRSSEEFSEFMRIDRRLDDSFNGSPVLNLQGEVAGIMSKDPASEKIEEKGTDTAVPADYFVSLVSQILKKGDISRPSLGINYIDLSQAAGITDKRFRDFSKGALVYGAPAKNSPAEKAGLKDGDVILKINNDTVGGKYGLTEMIQEYSPEDAVDLTISRGGEEQVSKAILGNMAE